MSPLELSRVSKKKFRCNHDFNWKLNKKSITRIPSTLLRSGLEVSIARAEAANVKA